MKKSGEGFGANVHPSISELLPKWPLVPLLLNGVGVSMHCNASSVNEPPHLEFSLPLSFRISSGLSRLCLLFRDVSIKK